MRQITVFFKRRNRTLVAFFYDIFISSFALYLAIVLRFDDLAPKLIFEDSFLQSCILLLIIQWLCFIFGGVYKGIWRFSSTPDLLNLFKVSTFSVCLGALLIFLFNRLDFFPRTIFVLDWLILIMGLGLGRFAYRMLKDSILTKKTQLNNESCIIVGAGLGGVRLLRDIEQGSSLNFRVVGFVDDDSEKKSKVIRGVPVLGPIENLATLLNSNQVSKVLIAIPSASGETMKRIITECNKAGVEFKTLPRMQDIIGGKVGVSQLRDVESEDLLGRAPVVLDSEKIEEMIVGKVVFVSGAGGSIGSEICSQVASFSPKKIILFELTEFFLYSLEMRLIEAFPEVEFVSLIGDIRNKDNLEEVFNKFKPDLVLHAAAYKHVPLMEKNPLSAVETNIMGTRNLVEVSRDTEVSKFVMISTDKAVNPTNIMGATKRVAEMIVQREQQKGFKTKFSSVRFGNVLGSSGSVVPLFKKQIAKGGPVTVTHRDVRRYFMSIPEACRLVLQSGALGQGGEVFILDMGEPVKIIDLAEQMISLSGLIPHKDIKIKVTGLRPGEKLFEELTLENENYLETNHPLVKIVKANNVEEDFDFKLMELLKFSKFKNQNEIVKYLTKIVPGFSHDSDREESLERLQ